MQKKKRLGVAATLFTLAATAAAPTASAQVGRQAPPSERPSIMQVQDLAHQSLAVKPPSAATATPAVSRPRATSRPAAGSYNTSGLTREVFGFAPYWELAGGDLSDVQYDKVSTVAYFGLTFNADGTFANDAGMTG